MIYMRKRNSFTYIAKLSKVYAGSATLNLKL